jgi:hypothetical protein
MITFYVKGGIAEAAAFLSRFVVHGMCGRKVAAVTVYSGHVERC